MEKILVTGSTGFAGSHLLDFLLTLNKYELFGTKRWRSQMANVAHLGSQVNFVECDMNDSTSVNKIIGDIRPDYILHLSAQSLVPVSWYSPAETLKTNIIGEINLFEAVRMAMIDPVILVIGSSEEYGLVSPDELPITETTPLRPLSPYAVSKVAQDYAGWQYFKSYGMKIVRTRAFNHCGPRRPSDFVDSSFARQLIEIENGASPVVLVGNLDAVRDYTDVRDIVKGYFLAVTKGEPGEVYNLCSGKGWKIKDVLDLLISLSDLKVEIKQDKARMRPSDVPVLLGTAAKFEERTGWKPEISFEDSMSDLLQYWRENGRNGETNGR